MCAGEDSNLRRPKPLGLQPSVIDHSTTDAFLWWTVTSSTLHCLLFLVSDSKFGWYDIYMRNRRALVSLSIGISMLMFVLGLASVSVQYALADNPNQGPYNAPTGLVSSCNGPNCQACNLVDLIQNVINYAIGLSIPIAMALFAYAGVLYFTESANPHGIETAKKIFRSALVGFIVALGAYLIVNTILHSILNTNTAQGGFAEGSWFTIQCTGTGVTNGNIGNLLTSVLGNPAPLSVMEVATTPTCPSGYSYQYNTCMDVNGNIQTPTYTTASGASVPSDPILSAEIAAACATNASSACSISQGISQAESSGGQNCTTSATGAAGCMQVLATTACGINSSISSSCGSCLSSQNSISAACAPVIQTISSNTQLGANLGVQYISQLQNMSSLQSLETQYGTCQITAAAYFQGPGKVLQAGGVPPIATSYVAKVCGN